MPPPHYLLNLQDQVGNGWLVIATSPCTHSSLSLLCCLMRMSWAVAGNWQSSWWTLLVMPCCHLPSSTVSSQLVYGRYLHHHLHAPLLVWKSWADSWDWDCNQHGAGSGHCHLPPTSATSILLLCWGICCWYLLAEDWGGMAPRMAAMMCHTSSTIVWQWLPSTITY